MFGVEGERRRGGMRGREMRERNKGAKGEKHVINRGCIARGGCLYLGAEKARQYVQHAPYAAARVKRENKKRRALALSVLWVYILQRFNLRF